MRSRPGFRLAGTIALSVGVGMWIGCEDVAGPTGAVQLTTATTGQDIDPGGYLFSVDGGRGQAIGVSETVTIDGLAAGNHDVELTRVPANCTVTGSNPRTVTVTAGAILPTTFQVSCAATTGSLEVTTATAGEDIDIDRDGYAVSVDGGARQAIGVSETVTISRLAEGDHDVELTGVAANCTVAGSNPRKVVVTAGDTAPVSFDVSCEVSTGGVVVTTVTGGRETDPDGYMVSVGGTQQAIGTNETVTIGGVSAGEHTVWLTGLAPSCAVAGGYLRTVTVLAGGTVQTTFEVVCQTSLESQIVVAWSCDYGCGGLAVMNVDGSGQTRLDYGGYDPAVSPDGTRILFASYDDIYVMNANGSGRVNLTQHPAFDLEPRWSPDGTRIVFTSDRDAGGAFDVFVMNADGSNPVNVSNHPARDNQASWSPDGTKLAFSSDRTGELEVFVMNSDGSDPVNLTNNPDGSDSAPAWSPDGTKIAFTRAGEIFVMNADGSNPMNLTNHTADDFGPSWSPDGSRITFTSNRTYFRDVFVMNADGSAQENLSRNGLAVAGFPQAWSP